MRAIQVAATGGSDVLEWIELPDPVAGNAQAVVALEACGVNFIDVYQRTGLYPVALPFVIGQEGAGVITAIDPAAGLFEVGDRVVFTGVLGGYAEQIVVPVEGLVKVPDGIGTDTAAAVMLQGLTAHYLVHDTYRLGPESRCLVHAGAGGVGQLLIQMAKQRGATVFATAGTEDKARLAQQAGADHVTVYTQSDFREEIEAVVGERSLDVVYDSVGQAATVFVNGPPGVYELSAGADGTSRIWSAVAGASGLTVIGGGDTVSSAARFIDLADIDYVSTAGGALIRYLSGQPLPVLAALERRIDPHPARE